MKQWVTLLAAIAIILAAGLYAFRDLDTKKATYANMDEARAAGAVARGWIPDWLPDDIRNIEEEHSLDRNDGMISFEWKGSLGELGPDCTTSNGSQVQANCPGYRVQRHSARVTMIRIVER